MKLISTNSEKLFRKAEPSDAFDIEECVCAAYAKYLKRMNKPPFPTLTDYRVVITQHQVWVMNDVEGCAAVLVLIPKQDHLLLDNIAVHPRQQGCGLGRTLIAFAETEAIKQGFSAVSLYTNECMTENIALYSRIGYEERGRMVQDGYSRIFMCKPLVTDAITIASSSQ
ncbi:GNAT family N-acetyltransferase [Nostoc sp. KVJ3]|uniref:GNAT family N-acetyltransferase n=1 Tax=Nostoc sp. KVJ3 TaxID=457945 RepID=UPI002238892D|nr:GNAT family N-acetyltransferase [Nostoc sp. KVJ3]MCW5318642.1 GNAT family N-acetyltransferase [Nostoc sp. KVJ3]